MSKRALLVIDILHDFLDPGGALYCGDDARKILPEVERLVEEHRADGSLIIFVMDCHTPDDKEFALFPPHCVAGTLGGSLMPGLEVLSGEKIVYKQRYSAFYGTELDSLLRRSGIDEVHLCGVCTSICVMDTCSDLRNRDLTAVVHRSAVADFDPAAHDFALKRIEKILGADVVE